MIIVTVQLLSARTKALSTLAQMAICNDGTSTDLKKGSYDVSVAKKGDGIEQMMAKPQRTGKVTNYARDASW